MYQYSKEDELYYIALSISKYVGVSTARYIISNIDDISKLFNTNIDIKKILPRLNNRVINSLKDIKVIEKAKNIVQWCRNNNISIVPFVSDDYPKLLSECPDAPILLYVKGNIKALDYDYSLSVVGTRNITNYGRTMTKTIVSDIGTIIPNMTIVSGLAFGVDIEAHRTSLSLGMPTIAVLAHGLDIVYPFRHLQDAKKIIEQGGALVSEYPPFTKPERYNFVARNRIIAGLSKATLVVEAGLKSGSLITAEIAIDYNREVFAVPGRVGDEYSEGCNDIISRVKAVLVTKAQDILSYMGVNYSSKTVVQTIDFAEDKFPDNPIIKIISEYQPIGLNELINISNLDMNSLSSILFDLELDGVIEAMPGGLYIIARNI